MSKSPRILLVEDEPSLNEVISLNLDLEGYEFDSTMDGQKVMDMVYNNNYQLIILDIMLPNVDGFTLCEKIRSKDSEIQILMISAKDDSRDKIQGLRLGADDYLSKPFDLEELLLRIKSLLKRHPQLNQEELELYKFGDNQVNFVTFQAKHGDNEFKLTSREIKLLQLLINRKSEVVSRDEILKEVWGYDDILPNTRTIDNFILNFRKYFEEYPNQPKHFESVWGVGYRFVE